MNLLAWLCQSLAQNWIMIRSTKCQKVKHNSICTMILGAYLSERLLPEAVWSRKHRCGFWPDTCQLPKSQSIPVSWFRLRRDVRLNISNWLDCTLQNSGCICTMRVLFADTTKVNSAPHPDACFGAQRTLMTQWEIQYVLFVGFVQVLPTSANLDASWAPASDPPHNTAHHAGRRRAWALKYEK